MKLSLSRNTKKNIASGIINRIVTILLSFIVRMILIRKIGLDFTGAKSLFNSILQFLSIAELGFYEAVTFALYKPVAEDDYDRINDLLTFLNHIYKVVSVVILVSGFCLIPFLSYIVNVDDYRSYNYVVIYILILFNYVMTYWFGSYKRSILNAYLRVNVINRINTYLTILMNACEIIVLVFIRNIYVYLSVSIIFTIANNLLIERYADQIYPHYRHSGKAAFSETISIIRKNVFGLSVRKISEIARHSLDNILLSMFLSLSSIAIFNNYLFISDSVSSFLYLITSSLIAGIGNRIQTATIDENYEEMRIINCSYMAISSWASCFLLCLYQPFMALWMGEQYTLRFSSVILITILFFIQKSGGIQSVYTEAKGLYWENKKRYLYEALLHLLLGLILTGYFKINGALVAGVISLFVFGGIFSPVILFKNYFHKDVREYFADLMKYSFTSLACCTTVYLLCDLYRSELWKVLLFRFVLCLVLFPFIYFLLFSKDELFHRSLDWIKNLIKN